jgi:hypothetical protein
MENLMSNVSSFRRSVIAVTAACFLTLGLQAPAMATVIGTQEFVTATDRAADLAAVESVLNRADVRTQLENLGVDPAQAAERVAALSDQELSAMAERLNEMPAGGDALAVIGIVFLILLILELVGVIDIFKRNP